MGIDVWWPGSAAFHVVRNVLKAEADGTSVSIENWIDGQLIDTQVSPPSPFSAESLQAKNDLLIR